MSTLSVKLARKPNPVHARELLEQVADPEIPVLTIADLGILRDVQAAGDTVVVTITPTYSGCPAMDTIKADIIEVLQAAGYKARVQTTLSPPWTTDWLSVEGREKLRAYGIAPPQQSCADKGSLWAESPPVPCPHCGSKSTQKLSEFGSTACKALYTCQDCHQPFDYFKCH